MNTSTDLRRAELEFQSRLLRERERTLRYLAQSARCSMRLEAEMELCRVRAELEATYEEMRKDQIQRWMGPGYPRI